MDRLFFHLKTHYLFYIFVFALIIFFLLTYKHIPIGNGEEYRLLRGRETLEHLTEGEFKEKLLQPLPNYFLYNLYPIFLILLNPNFYYEWFHLLNSLFSLLGFIAVYVLIFRSTKSVPFSLIGLFMLTVFPRFFGQLGFNPIDMPFMVFYLWSIVLILEYSGKGTNHWSVLLLGIVFGITQALRQLGFTIYLLMLISDYYDHYLENGYSLNGLSVFIKKNLLKYIYIFIIANFFMLITWPNFAINFFKSYVWYLFVGADFYLWDFGLLYFGKFLENEQRPWYYLPLFQLVMYPIYITVLFSPVVLFFKQQIKNKTYFLIVVSIVINYLLYFVLNPVLYDGIRHFLYLVPLFVIISIFNLKIILEKIRNIKLRNIFLILIFLGMIPPAIFTLKEYPYHYAYFNKLSYLLGNPYELFESDYANTKYREGTEWIRDSFLKDESLYSHSDPKKMLKVYACDNAYAVDYFSHKKFLSVINKNEADIFICDYRNLKQSSYTGDILRSFKIAGSDVLFVLRNE